MPYEKQNWENLPSANTPISAERLNHLETQYDEAIADTITDLLSDLRWPVYIAHRGSPMCYPEHSWEGYRASYEAGFSPEADVVALSDGTLVCLHDTTTNRTMNISKPVNQVTVDEWRHATINPPSRQGDRVRGTAPGTPVFFEDYLDEFGGRVLLWPEIKVASIAPDVIQAVVDRGLQRAVVLQSASLAVCQQVIAAGGYALMLGTSATPAALEAAGVQFSGVNGSAPQSFINDCNSRGIRVIGYTHNTKDEADAQLAKGMVGVFSDDPWEASRRYVPKGKVDLGGGFIPPGSSHSRSGSAAVAGPGTTQVVRAVGETLQFSQDTSQAEQAGFNSLKLGQLGYGGAVATVRLWVQAYEESINQNSWMFGMYLGRQDGDVAVNEEPGESVFRIAMVRRDGRKHAYNKSTPSGDIVALGNTTAPSTAYAPAGQRSQPMQFEVQFLSNRVRIKNLTLNDTDLDVTHTAWPVVSDLYLSLNVGNSNSHVWGVESFWGTV